MWNYREDDDHPNLGYVEVGGGYVVACLKEDAQLIAAAPDLQNALKTVVSATNENAPSIWRKAIRALQKADGEYVEEAMPTTPKTIAVYAGSFDPFTNGHLDIVRQASALFDVVYVIVSHNTQKQFTYAAFDMQCIIDKIFKKENLLNCYVTSTNDMTVDIARQLKATYLIRGLRTSMDYHYEESIAEINKELAPDIDTIYLRAKNHVVSSSMVRELIHYGKDFSKYVHPYVLDFITKKEASRKQ